MEKRGEDRKNIVVCLSFIIKCRKQGTCRGDARDRDEILQPLYSIKRQTQEIDLEFLGQIVQSPSAKNSRSRKKTTDPGMAG